MTFKNSQKHPKKKKNHSKIIANDHSPHVEAHEPAQAAGAKAEPRFLGPAVKESVGNPGDGEDLKETLGRAGLRVGEAVEEGEEEEGDDLLQVVQVGAAEALNVLIRVLDGHLPRLLCGEDEGLVLGVRKDLFDATSARDQSGHDEELQQ